MDYEKFNFLLNDLPNHNSFEEFIIRSNSACLMCIVTLKCNRLNYIAILKHRIKNRISDFF